MKNNDGPRKSPSRYYVYTLAEPDVDEHGSSRVFYVGKGCGGRVDDHEREARRGHTCHKCRRIRKIWERGKQIEKRIVFETPDELKAFNYEVYLINHYGLKNLVNVSPGGPLHAQLFDRPLRSARLLEITDAEYYFFLRRKPLNAASLKRLMERWYEKKLSHVNTLLRAARHNKRLNGWDTTAEIAQYEEEVTRLYIALGCARQLKMF